MSIKEEILAYIEKETDSYFQKNVYTFDTCNATVIAEVLYQDRTNVSRLLNQLFKDNLLIKKSGRPTLFIARAVVLKYYPFSNVPSHLKKEESITDYLSFGTHTKTKSSALQAFHLIGADQEGSLYPLIQRILPVLYLSNQSKRIILLQGKEGSGKKFFFQKLHQRFMELGIVKKDDIIEYIRIESILKNMDETFQSLIKRQISSVVIHIHDPKDIQFIPDIVSTVEWMYYTEEIQPILCFICSFITDEEEIRQITPIYGIFPALNERPQTEMMDLCILFIQKESKRLKKSIQFNDQFINLILSRVSSIDDLEKNIQYIIASELLESNKYGDSASIYLSNETTNVLLASLPVQKEIQISQGNQMITIHPEDTLITLPTKSEETNTGQSYGQNKNIGQLSPIQLFQIYLENYPNQNDTSNIKQEKFIGSLQNYLSKNMSNLDTSLAKRVSSILRSILIGKEKHNEVFFHIPSPVQFPANTVDLLKKMNKLIASADLSLDNKKQYEINNILSHAFSITRHVRIPILIISKYPLIAQTYKVLFNLYQKEEEIYTYLLDDPNENMKLLDSVYKYALDIDRGHGVIILTDSIFKSKIAARFFLYSKIFTHVSELISFPFIQKSLDLIQENDKNLLSITSNLFMEQNKLIKELKTIDLNSYSVRASNPSMVFLNELFPNINTYESNEQIYKLLLSMKKIWKLELTNTLIFEFSFMFNTLLFFKQTKIELAYLHNAEIKNEEFEMLLRQCISKNETLKKYSYSSGEIALFYEILDKNKAFKK